MTSLSFSVGSWNFAWICACSGCIGFARILEFARAWGFRLWRRIKFLVAWKTDIVRGGGGRRNGRLFLFYFNWLGGELSNRTGARSTTKLFCGVAGGLCYPVRHDVR